MTERHFRLPRALAALSLCLCAGVGAHAGTLNVSSPSEGAFVGSSTPIKFNITGGVQEITVTAAVSADVGGASTSLQTRVTPNTEGIVNDATVTWSPSQSFPEGAYTITVTAVELGNPTNTYNTEIRHVILDRLKPRLYEYSPLNQSAINGPVHITAEINEPNIDEWRVTVNDSDLPNNTGSTASIDVLWDPTNIEQDGSQTVKIIIKDRARNEYTQQVTIEVDRTPPVLSIGYPTSGQTIRPRSTVTILVSVLDASATSVDPLAMRVEIRDLSNNLIRRVPRLRYDSVNSNTARWVGRWRAIPPPGVTDFKIVVSAVDKAGNAAVVQEVQLKFGR